MANNEISYDFANGTISLTTDSGTKTLDNVTDITSGNIPYVNSGALADSPLSTDGTNVTVGNGLYIGGSVAANLLDDYEEGTFTPVVAGDSTAGAGTYTTQVGRYTKIGNRVLFSLHISWTAHTGTGNINVTGLPFSADATSGNHAAVSGYAFNLTYSAGAFLQFIILAGASAILPAYTSSGSGATQVPIDTAATLRISGQYEA